MSAEVRAGQNGLPRLDLVHPSGARAEVYLHGAHATSWRTPDGAEHLFVSERAGFDASGAIRGGVPIIFPQFSNFGPLGKHGFARLREWRFAGAATDADGTERVRLELPDAPELRESWPHPFRAEVEVALDADLLDIALHVANTGPEPLEFTAALHTYLRVAEIADARLHGLGGGQFRVGGLQGRDEVDSSPVLQIDGPLDRVYADAPDEVVLHGGGEVVRLAKRGFRDLVVWNPGAEGAARLDDLDDSEYRWMLCVEPANALVPTRLAPGERWTGTQTLSLGAG